MIIPEIENFTNQAVEAALKAGEIVMKYYNGEYSTTIKADSSPLTSADTASHECIFAALEKTELPVLSEEGKDIPWAVRKNWKKYWLVDPLDGTKEFIKHNGEFTINIALIIGNTPVIGVIYVPVTGILYFANSEIGTYRISATQLSNIQEKNNYNQIQQISEKLPLPDKNRQVTILASRSHLSPETIQIIEQIKYKFPECEIINAGSSLKFCRLAEGEAHYYPRFSPTMEWDTAAGHAIAAFAGITVNAWPGTTPLQYNIKESLVNPWFIAFKQDLPGFAN